MIFFLTAALGARLLHPGDRGGGRLTSSPTTPPLPGGPGPRGPRGKTELTGFGQLNTLSSQAVLRTFQKQMYFIGQFEVLSKPEQKGELVHRPPPPHPTASPHHQHPPPLDGAFVTTDASTSIPPPAEPITDTGVHSRLGLSVGLDRCVITCTHHYNVLQSSSTALEIPGALAVHPSHPATSHPRRPTPATTDLSSRDLFF